MITSTLKTLSLADKMSVPQLQQAVKDGTVPAYIAVPLIQQRMKDKQEASLKAAGAQQQQPPVADQVLSQADQQEALASLPANMPQQYATGGIVAFAEGDLVDDEEGDEDYRDALLEAELMKTSRLRPEAFSATPLNKTPATGLGYGNVQGQQMNADKTQYPGGGINALIGSAAEKHGVPVALAQNIARAESGGTMNMKGDPRSTAKGPFGMLESTWLGMGGTRENRADPEANVDLGTKLIRSNADSLKKSLGRNPTYGEVYAAHHFGSGVSKMLKNADPKESIEQGLSMFESPKRVNQIMAANPHLKGQTVGSVMAMMDKKGGQGIVDMADGGITVLPNNAVNSMNMAGGGIARFAAGDEVKIGDKTYTETDDPDYVMADGVRTSRSFAEQSAQSPWNTRPKGEPIQVMPEGLGENLKMGVVKPLAAAADVVSYPMNKLFKGVNALTGTSIPVTESDTPFYDKYVRGAQAPVTPTAVKPEVAAAANASAEQQKAKPYRDEGARPTGEHWAGKPAETKPAEAPPTVTPPKEPSQYDRLLEQIGAEREEAKKRAEQDRWMGLLTAGLGMMGGTSQNALANIGQGAMYGAQQYGQARKTSAAEQAALNKAEATALGYKSVDEYRKAEIQATEKSGTEKREQKLRSDAADDRERFFKQQQSAILSKYPKDPMMWSDAQRAQYDAEIQKIYTMPGYITLDRIASPSSYAAFKNLGIEKQ